MFKSAVFLVAALAAVSPSLQTPVHQPHEKRINIGGLLGDILGLRLLNNTFDYIIVGGGTAGLAVANRLSEDPNVSVAVLEGGPDYDQVLGPTLPTSTIFENAPGGDVLFCGSSPSSTYVDVDWQFVTEPQAGASNRKIHYARGRTLGGSSVRNFMIYQRGTKSSYDQWAELTGDDGWKWDNVLPYFKKSVAFTPPRDEMRNVTTRYDPNAFTSTGGPLQVSYPNSAQEFAPWMERGLNAIGLKNATDFNSGVLDGVSFAATSIRPDTGARASSRNTFLDAAQNRKNLHIYTDTLVRYVILNGTRAIGVQAGINVLNIELPALQTFYAKREVILSAGAFQTPQLLKVSGIGPRAELERLKIPVVVDLPGVGGGMEDHIFFTPSYPVHSKPFSNNTNAIDTFTRLAIDPVALLASVPPFLSGLLKAGSQSGPLTNNVADYLGWERFSNAKLDKIGASALKRYPQDWPTVEYLDAPGYIGAFKDLFSDQPRTLGGQQYASILGALVSPRSRGVVNITSKDTAIRPKIDPRWFTDPTDVAVGIELYKQIRRAFASDAMQPVISGPETFPGADVQTDEQIKKTIQDTLMTVWHASCTARAAKDSDPFGVTDSQLRVRGVQGLRVVDASAFPSLPPGHPLSSIYMLAERASDLIKQSTLPPAF